MGETAWKVGRPIKSARKGKSPVVSLKRREMSIERIKFATNQGGANDFHYLYANSNKHPDAPGNLKFWARGAKIDTFEWDRRRKKEYRACFTRNKPVSLVVELRCKTKRDLHCFLDVTPTLAGSSSHLKKTNFPFKYPANAKGFLFPFSLVGAMPDEIGRYDLKLKWKVIAPGVRFKGPKRTKHRIYSAYGQPLVPGHDSANINDKGKETTRSQGTLTGTRKRLDHLMKLVGGSKRRQKVGSQDDLVDLYWDLHKGINDTPGKPPQFNAANAHQISVKTFGKGKKLDVEDQWLAFVPSKMVKKKVLNPKPPPKFYKKKKISWWNDASCIGHVQVAKTMLAAVGLYARRTWIFPHTSKLPDGSTVKKKDEDLYCLGNYDPSRKQSHEFDHNGKRYKAICRLMEPRYAWENYEACMLTPEGKFLTGGYNTKSNPRSFRRNKGFNSAKDLLKWWSNTKRKGFGRRFLLWVYINKGKGQYYCWDVDGKWYSMLDYMTIRKKGKKLPPI